MSDTLASRIGQMINAEKWTRADLSEYTISSFQTFDEMLKEIFSNDIQDEAQEICEEHLQTSRDSVIGLYLAGIIALKKRIVDDSNLVVLTNMFDDSEKWNIVEFLCQKILEYGENKFALRTLADIYGSKDDHERRYEMLERLIEVDLEDADAVRRLAAKREQDGDLDGAIAYYKKALHRYINRRQFSQVRRMWEKVIEFQSEDLEGLLQILYTIRHAEHRQRWQDTMRTLCELQEECQKWLDTLPELAKKLQQVCALDLDKLKNIEFPGGLSPE